MITDEVPQSDDFHRYSLFGEKDGEKYVLDLNPGWFGPTTARGINKWNGLNEELYNNYAEKIVNTAWVDSDTTETSITSEHPEDEQIMENLRNFYMSHEKVDGVPVSPYRENKYRKFAIADFDADGEDEVMIEKYYDINGYTGQSLIMYKRESPIKEDISDKDIPYECFDDVTFLDNGVAYVSRENWSLDNRVYYLLNEDMPEKFNYDMSLTYESSVRRLVYRENSDGTVERSLESANEGLFDPVEVTQAEYEAEKAIIESGNAMDIQVKDFTAENVGL